LALDGCRFININNNQMEDGVDIRGCVGEEARLGRNVWGGQLPVVWGGILMDEKNSKMGGPFALDCRYLFSGRDFFRWFEKHSRPDNCTLFFQVIIFSGRNWCSYFDTNTNYYGTLTTRKKYYR
jgi:hypothetical protein